MGMDLYLVSCFSTQLQYLRSTCALQTVKMSETIRETLSAREDLHNTWHYGVAFFSGASTIFFFMKMFSRKPR